MMTARDLCPGDSVLTSRGVLVVDGNHPTGELVRTVVFTSGHSVTCRDDARVSVVDRFEVSR